MQPDVSIIIPVYNAEPFIRECLDSVRAQDYYNYEVLIINDGSTDNSYKILDEYCRADNRFACISQKNMGAGMARNTGIENANGKYILFLDADDMLEKDTLSDLLPLALENNLDMIRMSWRYIQGKKIRRPKINWIATGIVLECEEFFRSYTRNLIAFTFISVIFKACIIKDNRINFKYKFTEDILFNMEAILKCKRFYIAPKIYYLYRKSAYSITANFFSNYDMVCERNKASVEMLRLLKTSAVDVLTSDQITALRRSIISHAGMRYWMLQKCMIIDEGALRKLPPDTKLAIWGAGNSSELLSDVLADCKLSDIIFVDNDGTKQKEGLFNYRVISPSDMRKDEFMKYVSLIFSEMFVFELFAQMKDLGLVKSFLEMRLDIGTDERYDIQIKAMDELYKNMLEMGIEIDYPKIT